MRGGQVFADLLAVYLPYAWQASLIFEKLLLRQLHLYTLISILETAYCKLSTFHQYQK